MSRFAAAIDRFQNWYVASALPRWAGAGVDRDGAFFESLDFAGKPIIGQARRTRVQSRQIYTFTQAAKRGWLEAGDALAARGFARLVATACPDNAGRGCAHLINDGGEIVDNLRDLYDQAFLLLACSARIAAGDRAAVEIADNTLAFLDRELASPHGGFFENDRRGAPRRQNPHMHLFEAMMALYAATGDARHLARARAIEHLFNTRFLDRNCGVLREFFTDDWTLDEDMGDALEPGHMAEWFYLLHQFEKCAGEDRCEEKRLLYSAVRNFCAPEDRPFLANRASPGKAALRGRRRLWPQLEALKAALVQWSGDDAAAADYAADLIEAMFETYFGDAAPGLWCDEYDGAGRPIARDVPASILYHLHEAVSCAAECRHKIGA